MDGLPRQGWDKARLKKTPDVNLWLPYAGAHMCACTHKYPHENIHQREGEGDGEGDRVGD